MKCEKCQQREAHIHLTQMVDGKMCSLHLCEVCARDAGLDPSGPLDLEKLLQSTAHLYEELHQAIPPGLAEMADRILSRFAEQCDPGAELDPPVPSIRCPVCGCTPMLLRKTGQVGCPQCYVTFPDFIKGYLSQRTGVSGGHIGRIPRQGDRVILQQAAMQRLQHELDAAVAREDYETAATLRDELQRIKQEPGA